MMWKKEWNCGSSRNWNTSELILMRSLPWMVPTWKFSDSSDSYIRSGDGYPLKWCCWSSTSTSTSSRHWWNRIWTIGMWWIQIEDDFGGKRLVCRTRRWRIIYKLLRWCDLSDVDPEVPRPQGLWLTPFLWNLSFRAPCAGKSMWRHGPWTEKLICRNTVVAGATMTLDNRIQ